MKIPPITKKYNKKTVLEVPEINFEKAKIYAAVGSNGSGKSTFAKIISGTIKADNNVSIELKSEEKIRYLPQKSYPFRLKVRRSIMLGGSDEKRADYLAKELSLESLLNQNGHRLSGGESARVALSRVLMDGCELLILDEPTAAMDMRSTLAAERLVLEYRDKYACSVLWVTHSITQAERTADELIFLSEGKLIEFGEIRQLLTNPKSTELESFLEFYRLS